MPKSMRSSKLIRPGSGHLVADDEVPEEIRGWPRWRIAIWVALAEGRRYSEVAAAATAAAEAAGETPSGGLPVLAPHVLRVVRDGRYREHFASLVDARGHPRAEPAMDLLEKLVAEGMADHAQSDTKQRALAAAKEILRVSAPSFPVADRGSVQVNVSGDGARVAVVGLDDLLRGREPLRPRQLTAGPAATAEAALEVEAVPVVEATQPRRSRTSSQRSSEQRARVREQAGRA